MDDPNDDSIISNESEASSYTTPTPRRSTFGRTSDIGLPESSIPTPLGARSKRDSFAGGSKLPLGNRRVSSGLGTALAQDVPIATKRPGSRTSEVRPTSRAGAGGDVRPTSRAGEMRPPSVLGRSVRGNRPPPLGDVGETF